MIAIVNYKMGNLRSVENALSRLGADFKVTENAEVIKNADRVLLPGVGHAAEAMNNLSEAGLTDIIRNLRCPVLGIFDARVKRFHPSVTEKVPHMGWNCLGNMETKLFQGIESGSHVYFVHSYFAGLCPDTIATTGYGQLFSASLKYENFYGVQFHPEKSGAVGERILQNFLTL